MESRSFSELTLNFYFAIGPVTPVSDQDPTPEEDRRQQHNAKMYTQGYNALCESLPKLKEWVVVDEQDPEMSYSPFEVCQDEPWTDSFQGDEAYSFAIYSPHKLSDEQIQAFKKEVVRQFTRICEEDGTTFTLLGAELYITEKISSTVSLKIDGSPS